MARPSKVPLHETPYLIWMWRVEICDAGLCVDYQQPKP